MPKYKLISEPYFARHYRARAYLNPKTGRLLKITAGCRTWHSISEAVSHYAGGRPYLVNRWKRTAHTPNVPEFYSGSVSDLKERNDGLLAIARLTVKVLAFQRKRRKA